MGLATDLERTYIGLATNASCGAEPFKKISHDGQKNYKDYYAPLVLEPTISL